ncbi:hypothetical protein MMC22_009731 [Lobaria immixta]|nr:hypothetical protein [Lobaria immixta]
MRFMPLQYLLPLFFAFGDIAQAHRHVKHFAERNLDTISKIYNRTTYPTLLEFIANRSASVPSGLFNANAKGRITPVGNFTGFDDSTEYFFALSPVPVAPSYLTFLSATITHFTSGCPEIASSVVHFRNGVFHPGSPDDGKYVTTLKQVAFWKFDDAGAVLEYEAWIPSLRLYANSTGPVQPTRTEFIQQICGTMQQLCTGPNAQYSSFEDCTTVLSQKPYGDYDNLWADNVHCRSIHLLLARIRPSIHCPHLGPTGGGKCVDVSYNSAYFDDQELFGAPTGGKFMCK